MKKILALLLCTLLLAGCASDSTAPTDAAPTDAATEATLAPIVPVEETPEVEFVSRFDSETAIVLSDTGITVNGGDETDTVFTSHDIVYYEDKDTYESGNPYGEGTDADKHTAEEADAHTVVNITAPGAYRVSGKLSAGQIRIDLGEDAYENPDAVVELILDGADITCTVAPAILFLNTYECDGNWSTDTATPNVDTTAAGANLILEGENTVSGSYVARIYKDKEGEKKLWKQDGAIYSYMSLNVYGPGSLDLTAANEGLDTELHLTINGGSIAIRSGNDGINTNEDGVSVTTINAGTLHIIAGLGEEGDGIDSNGYLVINGGTVVSSANPAADAGLDSDMGSYINGGTVIALGSTMDWAESDSDQVTMNLQFASQQSSGSSLVVTREDGTVIFAYDPSEDEVLGENVRQYMGAIVSCPYFTQGESYHVYLDGAVAGSEKGGVYDITTVTGFEGGVQQAYSGTDVTMGPGGMGGFGGMGNRGEGGWPTDTERTETARQEPPEGFDGEMPQDFTLPEGETMPEGGFGRGEMPEGFTPGETFPQGEMPGGGFGGGRGQGGRGNMPATGEANTAFYMQDKVNCFSGITAAE
ncbi:MAG: carbohydrate-binding domain-containing protein [Oscillospiraceae bacterium]|nr:carbohydrate-binding domain-containing protein [Oscillospiraceae bacterium]